MKEGDKCAYHSTFSRLNVTNEQKNLDSIKHHEPSTSACKFTTARSFVYQVNLRFFKKMENYTAASLDPIAKVKISLFYYHYCHYYCFYYCLQSFCLDLRSLLLK